MRDRFLAPPFSVLDARQGYWRDLKREWLSLGIKSEEGRKASSGAFQISHSMKKYAADLDGRSVFDPVLCEVIYRWFSPNGGVVIDPFAGGSVRGIVASKLSRKYLGIELRKEQEISNVEQANKITPINPPRWVVGDAKEIASLVGDTKADLVFSCPPYYNLEVYSDDPNDLSNAPTYEDFLLGYGEIILNTASVLKDNRFACFVVGDVRDDRGIQYPFVADTIRYFNAAGLGLYNVAILITPAGTLPFRAAAYFNSSRKLGNSHQYVLIFIKGDPKIATEVCGINVVEVTNSELGEWVE